MVNNEDCPLASWVLKDLHPNSHVMQFLSLSVLCCALQDSMMRKIAGLEVRAASAAGTKKRGTQQQQQQSSPVPA